MSASKFHEVKEFVESVTGSTKTEKEIQWFLAMWTTQDLASMTWKERAEWLQHFLDHQPNYATLAAWYMESIEESYADQLEHIKQSVKEFYGIK